MARDSVKANGVHYTPPELAKFLAGVMAQSLSPIQSRIEVLDPACGDGALLASFVEALPAHSRRGVTLYGYETDPAALKTAEQSLARAGVRNVVLACEDFLSLEGIDRPLHSTQLSLLDREAAIPLRRFDAVIANPPYVRTQVLGASKSQELAKRFGLTGRVDLYHAFTKAMANVLRPGGVLGLLTSNRFLTIKSGAALRRLLRAEFDVEAIYDLGDTKLFSAAVLPVVVLARRQKASRPHTCFFDRVYECRERDAAVGVQNRFGTVLDAFRNRDVGGVVGTPTGVFRIERGVLLASNDDQVWSLSNPHYEEWMNRVRSKQAYCFENVAHIRVGIKTTADEVFIRDDWESLPIHLQPEATLLRPLLTHLNAQRWIPVVPARQRQVLYPHVVRDSKRTPVDLQQYPRARGYLECHRERLARRTYVREAGRRWYEIWVPHNPADWMRPKVVFPDIAEEPRFFFDSSGAVANGDCYWITLRPGFDPEWLFLILAVANSSLITKYYDIAFHNKLYAGRRRFMTQYVKMFPLPSLSAPMARRIVRAVAEIVADGPPTQEADAAIDDLVWEAFGLTKEVGG